MSKLKRSNSLPAKADSDKARADPLAINPEVRFIELRRRLHHATAATTSTQIDQILDGSHR